MKELLKKNYIGAFLGLIFPLLSVFIFYKIQYSYYTLTEFINMAFNLGIHLKIISLGVFTNLVLFFIFIWSNYLQTARGVLLATFIYAITIFAIKLIF